MLLGYEIWRWGRFNVSDFKDNGITLPGFDDT